MKWILEKLRNTRLQIRLSFPVVAAMILLLLSQWTVFAFCVSVVNRNMVASADSAAVSIRSHADIQIQNIIEQMYYTRLDEAVEKHLTDYLLRDDRSTEAVTSSMLSYALSLRKATEPMLASLLVYTPKHTFGGGGTPMVPDYDFEASVLYQILRQEGDAVVFAPPMLDETYLGQRNVVPLLFRFRIDGYPEDCALLFNLDQEKLTAYISEAVTHSQSHVLLVSESGIPVTSSSNPAVTALLEDRELLEEILSAGDQVDAKLNGESYLVSSIALESAPWRVVYLQSQTPYLNMLHGARTVYLTVTFLTVLLTLWALSRCVDTVTRPLAELCRQIRIWETEDRSQEFRYPYQDEIGVLARSYNSMVSHIEHLQREQIRYIHLLEEEKARADEEQTLKRRAELTALQAQINPHFLYNTLDSIRWKAEMAGADDISRMTTALATLFRISLSQGREIITVEQELRHVESYLMIQKMRYSDRMAYSMDVDPEILKLTTVKLILQPLVENAIYHGIKESTHSGSVFVTGCRMGDVLQLQVSDNGLGIPEQKLALLQADLARGKSVSREGYGIFNVNERIRLHYGPQYGLTLESQWGRGTVATVRLPCKTLLEVENELSHFDRG